MRKLHLHPSHQIIIERRNFTVLLGAKALQPGLSGMDDDVIHPCSGHRVDEGGQHNFGVLLIHPDPALYRDRHVRRVLHRRHTFGHQRRPFHQHRAKTTRLHPVGRTSHVQIDLIIAPSTCNPHRLGQFRRFRPTQLQGQRMLLVREIQQPRRLPMYNRRRRHHLGIKHRPPSHQPMEIAAMPVRPIHHRGNRQAMRAVNTFICRKISHI